MDVAPTRSPWAAIVAVAWIAIGGQNASAQQGALTAAYEPPATRAEAFPLTIQSIMRAEALVGRSPNGVRFSDDSEWIYFNWVAGGGDWFAPRELYKVRASGGEPLLVSDDEAEDLTLSLAQGDLSPDRERRVISFQGDLWMIHRDDGSRERITETQANEASPFFAPEGDRIFYRQGSNLFEMHLENSTIRQVTDIRGGPAPRDQDREAEGQERFLEDQQRELFEFIRRRAEERDEREAEAEGEEDDEPAPLYAPSGERLGQMIPAPNGHHVLISSLRPAASDGENTMVPFWITESGYTEGRDVRTKVGEDQSTTRVGLVTTASGAAEWIDIELPGYDGPVRTSPGSWNDQGSHALVVTRSEDREHWWLHSVRATDGSATLLEYHHDEAWVGGPCGGCMGWLPGTDRAYFVNESTGYAHLYTVNGDGSDRRALTSGEWEVLGVQRHDSSGRFLMTTNEGSPFNQHVGWLDFDGGSIDYLTSGDGSYTVTLSPDGERLAILHSVANRPPELFVAEEGEADEMEQITLSPTEEWLSFPWVKPEIVQFAAEDGTMVPARIYRPSDMGAEPNGAGVIFVHGAGYLHNVHNYWSTYYREYMFNHFLAANGYVVMDIDYRGSAGYGRDWRTGIYRWMGGKDLSDHVDGARYMVASEGVDAERIGLYGGSYGGFITLMGLFTAGDTFKSGAALRSVTDWAHYNHGYTSNILNTPQEDEEAYRRSSPIYFAENFGPDQHLVMLHGMVDTNVHFSDVVRLSQRLIELGKENWELAVYPVENHGFTEPTSWVDEYRRIFELFERTLSAPGCTENGSFCSVPRAPAPMGSDLESASR